MVREVEEAARKSITFDEDCLELSPAMMKAFKCSVIWRNKRNILIINPDIEMKFIEREYCSMTKESTMADTGISHKVINEIQNLADKYGVKEVILFGSRARGDYERASDIDLAVRGGNISEFSAAVREETSTLLDFDIIDMEQSVEEKLRNSINGEGLIVYEKV